MWAHNLPGAAAFALLAAVGGVAAGLVSLWILVNRIVNLHLPRAAAVGSGLAIFIGMAAWRAVF
jgi:hypothetical protein